MATVRNCQARFKLLNKLVQDKNEEPISIFMTRGSSLQMRMVRHIVR